MNELIVYLSLAVLFGFLLGLGVAAVAVTHFVNKRKGVKSNVGRTAVHVAVAMLGAAAMFGRAGVTFAQTDTPTITIPTDVIFSETNNWIETFAPISAIGIGITVAVAVLGYLGKTIAGAFK